MKFTTTEDSLCMAPQRPKSCRACRTRREYLHQSQVSGIPSPRAVLPRRAQRLSYQHDHTTIYLCYSRNMLVQREMRKRMPVSFELLS